MNRPRARKAHGAHDDAARRDAAHQDAVWLATALREQADEHEADLHRIEARFDRLTVAEPRRVRRRRPDGALRLRLLGVPLGVLAAAATATIAVGVTLGISAHTAHPTSQAATSPSQSRSASGQQSATPGASATPTQVRPAGTASTRDESSPSSSPSPVLVTGPVTAAGTVDSHSTRYWAQEDLSVTTTRVIHALQVTVTVSGGATVQSTGSWSAIPAAYVDIAVSRTSGGLTYDFALKPGLTLPPGTYAFGMQFNRPAAGHNFGGDVYTVTADATGDAKQPSAAGTFVG